MAKPEGTWEQPKVAYETHANVNRAETATVDGRVLVLENGKPYETSDPHEQAALDAHPSVKVHRPETRKADS